MRRFYAAVGLGLLALVALPLTAHADEEDWSVPRYAVSAVAATGGTVDVTLDFDFDFAGTAGHGPYVTLPVRQEIEGDPDHYRSFAVTDLTASSPSGAPAQVETETDGGALAARVGDKNVEVDGLQTYRLSYRIAGVVNPGVGTAGADEIFWNVVGSQWEVPLSDVTVTLAGPAAIERAACYSGESGSDQACGGATVAGDTVTYTQRAVEPGSGLTVVAAWPAGTFVGAEPVLVPRHHLGNTFALTPWTGGAAGLVALLGVGALLQLARRRGRDRAYVGLTPGLSPTGTDGHAATTARGRTPVAVRFTPPEGVRPGELGTVLNEVAPHPPRHRHPRRPGGPRPSADRGDRVGRRGRGCGGHGGRPQVAAGAAARPARRTAPRVRAAAAGRVVHRPHRGGPRRPGGVLRGHPRHRPGGAVRGGDLPGVVHGQPEPGALPLVRDRGRPRRPRCAARAGPGPHDRLGAGGCRCGRGRGGGPGAHPLDARPDGGW